MAFETRQKVLFRHCDPAGIVFFPRFFEMINDCVEKFFSDALGWPFEDLLAEAGVPTAGIQTEFLRPCRHGEDLVLSMHITRLGRTSMSYRMTGRVDAEARFKAEATIVHVDLKGAPSPWPRVMRQKLLELKDQSDES